MRKSMQLKAVAFAAAAALMGVSGMVVLNRGINA